jgi:hypothetical protein
MACTETILMILKRHHVQEVHHLRETRTAENIVFGRCQEKANLVNVVEKGKILLQNTLEKWF